ncbi:hypothetical protein KAR91_55620 [Candidatus Pacearchaeota archaeon]|nr:hypothetical protein [Candidatus Pacearchaeota archaeon]
MDKSDRNHRMLCRLCETELTIKEVGLAYNLSPNATLGAVRKQIVGSGVKLENGKPPFTVLEIKSTYQDYCEVHSG